MRVVDADKLKKQINDFFTEVMIMNSIVSGVHKDIGMDVKTMEATQCADRHIVLEIIDDMAQEVKEESKPKVTIEQWYDSF